MQVQVEHPSVPSQTTRQERRYGVYMTSHSTSPNSSPRSHMNTPSTLSGMVFHRTSASEPAVDENIIILDSTGIVTGPMPSLRPISIGIYRKSQGGIRKVELPPIVTDLKGYKKASASKRTVAGPMERGRTKDRELAGAGGLLKAPDDHRHGRSGTRPRVLAMQKPRPFLEAPIVIPQKLLPPLQPQPVARSGASAGQENVDHDRPDLLCPPPAPKPPSLILHIPIPVASSPTPKLFNQLQLTPINQLLPSVVVSNSVEEQDSSPQPFLRLISLQLRSKVYQPKATSTSHHYDAIASKPVLSQLITTDLTNYRLNAQAAAAQQAATEISRPQEKQKQKASGRPSLFQRKSANHTASRQSDSENEPRSRDSSHSSARSHSQDRRNSNRRDASSDHNESSTAHHTWLRRKARGVVLMVSGCIKDPEGKQEQGGSGVRAAAVGVVLPVVAVAAPPDSGSGSDPENVESRNSTTRRKRNRDIVKERVRKLFSHHTDVMDFEDSRLEEHWVYVERCLEQPNTSAVDMLAATGLPFGASSPRPTPRVQEVPVSPCFDFQTLFLDEVY